MSGVLSAWMRRDMMRRYFDPSWSQSYTDFGVALVRKVPPVNASVPQLDEPPAYAGYGRENYPVFGAAGWSISDDAIATNLYPIVYAPANSAAWGTLGGYALVTGGSLAGGFTPQVCAVGRLIKPVRVSATVFPVIPAGAISISLDG